MSDQETEEIFQELLEQENQQEITRATTVQGQIIGLVVLLRDIGILTNEHVEHWGSMSETISELLRTIATKDHKYVGETEADEVDRALQGTHALIKLSALLGVAGNGMEKMQLHAKSLKERLDVLRGD